MNPPNPAGTVRKVLVLPPGSLFYNGHFFCINGYSITGFERRPRMRKIFLRGLSLCLPLFLLPLSALGAQVAEVEPNNQPEQATSIQLGDTVTGKIHHFDVDLFHLTLPESGIVTVKLSGLPADCKSVWAANQVAAAGFDSQAGLQPSPSYRPPDVWRRLRPGRPASVGFSCLGVHEGAGIHH